MDLKFSHINMLVNDLDEAATYFPRVLGFRPSERRSYQLDPADPSKTTHEAIIMFNDDTRFGLLHPLSGILKEWLATKGPGTIYRYAFTTPNAETCYKELVAAGLQPVDIERRPITTLDGLNFSTGTKTMLLWPGGPFGDVSIEILERANFEGRMAKLRLTAK